MRVMVTGGAGFIGSHTVDKLVADGAEVLIVDDFSTGREENLHPGIEVVRTNIASEKLSEVFRKWQPEYVIHLAAQVSVPVSVDRPVEDCLTNVTGSVNILENCRQYGVKKVVYASSAAVYGDPVSSFVSESDTARPLSFYGVSKLAPEYYLKAFHSLYGLRYTVLRYANVFGPRQGAAGEGGVVSIFAKKLRDRINPCIHGDGEQTRDFIYVGDIAAANLRALDAGDLMTLNVGTGTVVSINELLNLMGRLARIEMQPVFAVEPVYTEKRDGDIRHMCMDIGYTVKKLDWKPRFSLEEGLSRTLKFYLGQGVS